MLSLNEIKQAIAPLYDEMPDSDDYDLFYKVYIYNVEQGFIAPIPEKPIILESPIEEDKKIKETASLSTRFACAGFIGTSDRTFHGKDAEVVLSILMNRKPDLDWANYGNSWLVKLSTRESEEIQWYNHIIKYGAKNSPHIIETRYRKVHPVTLEPISSKLTVANERGSDNHDLQSQATFGFKSTVKFAVLEWDYNSFEVITVNQSLPFYLDNWQSGKQVFEYRLYNQLKPFYKWWNELNPESFNKYWHVSNRYWLKVHRNLATNKHHEVAKKLYLMRYKWEQAYKAYLVKPLLANKKRKKLDEVVPHDYQSPYANGKVKKAKSKMSSGGKNPNSFSSTSSSLAKHRLSDAVSTQSRFYKDGNKQYKLELRYGVKIYQVWTTGQERLIAKIDANRRIIFENSINSSNVELKERVERFLVVDKPQDKRTTKESERIAVVKPMSDIQKNKLGKLNKKLERKQQRQQSAIERKRAESGKKQYKLYELAK